MAFTGIGRPFVVIIFCLTLHFHSEIIPKEVYPYSLELVPNEIYTLFWKYDESSITFEVHVKTLGYVGFGISSTGRMKESDIVLGWVKDEEAYIYVSRYLFLLINYDTFHAR